MKEPKTDSWVGRRVRSYEVLSRIGAGGMGEVYRARDTKLGREVALKVLPEEFAHDPGRLRRFEQEARSASALILLLDDVEEEPVDGNQLEQLLQVGLEEVHVRRVQTQQPVEARLERRRALERAARGDLALAGLRVGGELVPLDGGLWARGCRADDRLRPAPREGCA